MKKLLFIAFCLTAPLKLMAYYGSYSSSDSSGWAIFISIIMLVGGILEIVLFFKIWGMTNDIKALKKDHFGETPFETNTQLAGYLRRNLILGNIDNVKRILLHNFIDNVERAYDKMPIDGWEKDENGSEKWVKFKEKNLKESIIPYVEDITSQLSKIGEEVPIYIKQLKTFGDYYNLFKEEELIVDIQNRSEENK